VWEYLEKHYEETDGNAKISIIFNSIVKPDYTLQNLAQVREYLEKHYEETEGEETTKLALKALTETVEASAKNIEVALTTKTGGERQDCQLYA